MSTAPKTDTRDQIGGYPLPWKIVDRDRMGGDLVDDDGDVITNFGDDQFYVDLAAGVNQASARIAALEAAKLEAAAKVPVRPDEILFIAASVRGLLDMLVTPDDGTQHRATVLALAAIRDMVAGYVPDAERLIREGYARRDVGAEVSS